MAVAIALVAGVLSWSLAEYCVHRWLGHDKRSMPNFFSTEHIRHHSEGNYFAPAYKKTLAAAVMVAMLLGLALLVGQLRIGIAYAAGFVGFYLFYEVLHRLEHVHAGLSAYGRWARRHHFHHHFHNPKCNHGVTSPLWDLVFGTYERPAQVIRVPQRLAMRWLADPATGDVRAVFSDRYELRRPRRPRAA